MTTIDAIPPVDAGKLEQFVFRAVDEIGATLNAALVVMGDQLGLYRALAGAGALTPAELAERTGTAERYVREWLNAQAAGGYVDYADGALLAGARAGGRAHRREQPRLPPRVLRDRTRLRAGLAADHRGRPRRRRSRLARAPPARPRRLRALLPAGYNAHLIESWLPALDGVVERSERGARVADVGCGHGASTILMARAFPTRPSSGPTTTPARSRPRAGARPRPASPAASLRGRPAAGFSGGATTS